MRIQASKLKRDFFNLNLSIRLSVTDLLLLVLFGFVGHNVDLLALAVLYYVSRYCCAFYCGLAGLESVCCRYCENLVKDNSFAFSGIELLNEDDVSLVDLYCFPPVSIIANIVKSTSLSFM